MRNWLPTKRGVTNLSISYVIHKDNNPLTMHNSKLIIYNVSLTTAILKDDSRKVANILIPLVMDTDPYEWGGIKLTQSKGREVWLDLVSNYNGSSKSERCIATARIKLSNLFYKNEMTFNFETFSTNLKANFIIIEKYGEGRSEQEKVSIFIDNIYMRNQRLESTTNVYRSNNNGNYLTAINYRATQTIFVFPEQQLRQQQNHDPNKKNYHMLRRTSSVIPSRAMALPYLIRQGSS